MKKYSAPEFEELKYDVKDCLATSSNVAAEGENGGSVFDKLTEWH